MSEEWKDFPDWEGLYEVSNMGRVRNKRNGFVLKGSVLTKGYVYVFPSDGKRRQSFRVHAVVMRAWVGDRPEGLVIDHIDDDRTNNKLSNLRYISTRENVIKSYKNPYPGAFRYKKKWRAKAEVGGKAYHLGDHETREAAHIAYMDFCIARNLFVDVRNVTSLQKYSAFIGRE